MQRVINADTSRAGLKVHEYANYALAGATPLALLGSKGGLLTKAADMVFAFALPTHMHITMNAVVSDYLPKVARGPARLGLVALSGMTFLGLMKLNLTGPGITDSVRGLWRKPEKK
ncbi:hypothetical protein FOA52_002568 [Chlamydomonas sp. UWO 241]|nr:hypothetical protein FOA52_002568 [Chlamydomonas sp. UWO 241]